MYWKKQLEVLGDLQFGSLLGHIGITLSAVPIISLLQKSQTRSQQVVAPAFGETEKSTSCYYRRKHLVDTLPREIKTNSPFRKIFEACPF